MRFLTVLLGVVLVNSLQTQAPDQGKSGRRYGIEPDVELFPQNTAKDALASVIKAIDRGRIDYLLAQVADPQFVDNRVKVYGGNFDELVKETTTKLSQDPTELKEMRQILRDGEWQEGEGTASAHLKDKERTVFFKKIGDRWYLENRQKDESSKP